MGAALAVGTILGLAKNASEQGKFDSQKQVQAATTRYSPWTHMEAPAPQYGAGLIGNVAGGLASGYALQQANPDAASGGQGVQLNQSMTPSLSGGSSWNMMGNGMSGPGTSPQSGFSNYFGGGSSPMALGGSQMRSPSIYGLLANNYSR